MRNENHSNNTATYVDNSCDHSHAGRIDLKRLNVDLDADHSDGECSARSFSTSGVSSLLPRSWALGPKSVYNKNSCLARDISISPSESTVDLSHTKSPLVSHDCLPNRFSKRRRIFNLDSVHKSRDLTLNNHQKPVYGGASGSRSIRDMFKVIFFKSL